MPRPQDLVGKLIKYVVRVGQNLDVTKLQNGVLTKCVKLESLALHDMVGAIGGPQGRQIKNSGQKWDFDFLEYYGGYVTVAPLGRGVLTGPMSGCYLCKYTENGVPSLAHIGTVDNNPGPTLAVKKAWKTFVARKEVSNVSGANPFDSFSGADLAGAVQVPGQAPEVAGYFDATGNGYAVLLAKVKSHVGNMVLPGVLQIAQVKAMALQPWSALATHPKFA